MFQLVSMYLWAYETINMLQLTTAPLSDATSQRHVTTPVKHNSTSERLFSTSCPLFSALSYCPHPVLVTCMANWLGYTLYVCCHNQLVVIFLLYLPFLPPVIEQLSSPISSCVSVDKWALICSLSSFYLSLKLLLTVNLEWLPWSTTSPGHYLTTHSISILSQSFSLSSLPSLSSSVSSSSASSLTQHE